MKKGKWMYHGVCGTAWQALDRLPSWHATEAQRASLACASVAPLDAYLVAEPRAAVDAERWVRHSREAGRLPPAGARTVLADAPGLLEGRNAAVGPRAETRYWRQGRGRVIPGATCAGHAAADLPGRSDWNAIVFGGWAPSAMKQAGRSTVRHPAPGTRLVAALDDGNWFTGLEAVKGEHDARVDGTKAVDTTTRRGAERSGSLPFKPSSRGSTRAAAVADRPVASGSVNGHLVRLIPSSWMSTAK